MKLNLREIIEIPGGSVQFAQELDTALLDFPSVRAYTAPITAEGKVVNTAGILTLQGKLHAQMLCVCDRCGAEFPRTVDLDRTPTSRRMRRTTILRCLRSTETGSMWTRCSPPASSSAWIPSACASPTVPDCATAAART